MTVTPTSPAAAGTAGASTHGQIVKSSAIIGGSSMLNVGFGMIRTKAMAVLLGPEGVALMGLYNVVLDVTRSLAGMGINNSGVRQIAEAVGSGDAQRIARTVTTLRRVAFWTGALGAVLLVLFSRPVSLLTFENPGHSGALMLLAVAVFFADVSAGQAALVQGMRRLADLARMNVLGAFYGTVLSIPIVFIWRQQGIVPSLVAVAGMSILTSWWYARKVKVQRVSMTFRQVMEETSGLLRLGVVLMVSSLLTMVVTYLVRIIVLHRLDLQATGYYQAAWQLGGLYFGFILQAMGTDFYPRLTAVAQNNQECNRLINEQAEVGLLLAGPGVLGTLTFAPLVIELFYTHQFGPAEEVLRWICLGMILRVACWPMAFILLAKGEGRTFFWTEVVSNAIQVALVWGGIVLFGLKGTGIAFFALYLIYGLLIYCIIRRLSGFRWSLANRQLAGIFIPLIILVFGSYYILPQSNAGRGMGHVWSFAIGAVATLFSGFYSLRKLCLLVPLNRVPARAIAVLKALRILPPDFKP